MDAMTSALTLLLLAVGGIAIAMRSTAGATMVIGHLFYVPDPHWPDGVQEDDDLHWSWARTRTSASIAPPAAVAMVDPVPIDAGVPSIAEVMDGASPVGTSPVRGLVSRR
jgi:hypothetical protein